MKKILPYSVIGILAFIVVGISDNLSFWEIIAASIVLGLAGGLIIRYFTIKK